MYATDGAACAGRNKICGNLRNLPEFQAGSEETSTVIYYLECEPIRSFMEKLHVLGYASSMTGIFLFLLLMVGCTGKPSSEEHQYPAATSADTTGFKADVDFLRRFTPIIVLEDPSGKGKVAVSPALQGRVMTSTSEGDSGLSYGWINRAAFLSGDTSDHINVFGGEDRFWLGPEGGQFSIYFAGGKEFNLDNWHVPRLIDLDPFKVTQSLATEAVFTKQASLTNYSGTVFTFVITRTVRLITQEDAWHQLGIDSTAGVSFVAYETLNHLQNTGASPWKKETGLLSIWILGMFNPSENTTIIVPYEGKSGSIREAVNDRYFGPVPGDRLKFDEHAVYFSADGKYRSKIGLPATVATEWLGSYDADNGVLTLVKYSRPVDAKDYVNSLWEIQQEPYRGDAVNAYNDGPPSPGAKPLGPFYELESSSPAAALVPGGGIKHVHATYHIKGTPAQLDPIMRRFLKTDTGTTVKVFGEK